MHNTDHWTTDKKIVKRRVFKNIASIATMVTYFPIQSRVSTVRLELVHKRRQLNINMLQLWILPKDCIYVFHLVATVNCDHFPKQH
jgi:hypothetical protein